MKTIQEILRDYTTGKVDLAKTNAALKEAGAAYHLEPGRNELTEADRRETVVGYYPEQARGWGLLDTGTGSLDKVRIDGGALSHAVNEVLPDGRVNMAACVTVCGRTYAVLGNKLAEVREDRNARKTPPLPVKADLRRRVDLAGRTVVQQTGSGCYEVCYDEKGYAVRSRKLEAQP